MAKTVVEKFSVVDTGRVTMPLNGLTNFYNVRSHTRQRLSPLVRSFVAVAPEGKGRIYLEGGSLQKEKGTMDGMNFDVMDLPDLADASSVAPSNYQSSGQNKDYLEFGQEAPPPFMAPPASAAPGEDSSLTFMAAPRGMHGGTTIVHPKMFPVLGILCVLAALVLFLTIVAFVVVLVVVRDIEYDVNHLKFKIADVW